MEREEREEERGREKYYGEGRGREEGGVILEGVRAVIQRREGESKHMSRERD